MAIVQISQITNRKGLQDDLPQLAGAELGWSIDQRRLWIGNGTLAEGAPVVGNTEILTEFSDILDLSTSYTYKGEAAGYTVQTGPTLGNPVTLSLQSWFDQWATVKDFGAVGDGLTDDTDAINRALFQIYCRETNTQIRRAIFFPAGTYRVTGSINIPPYATLYGEGKDNSIIQLDTGTLAECVARTADSLQQTGVNISNGGATPPQNITISNMSFQSLDSEVDIFIVEDVNNCCFQGVSFIGAMAQGDLNPPGTEDSSCIRFGSTPSLITNQVVFDDCQFSNCVYGINTATSSSGTDQQVKGVTVSNSKFDTLFQGVVLGSKNAASPPDSATGFRIVSNMFDNIYAEGVLFGSLGAVTLNATAHNIFYDVGNHFLGVTNPRTPIIDIEVDNNVSIGDMFARQDVYATTYPRVALNNTVSIATVNGVELSLGNYTRTSGKQFTLINNTSSPSTIFSLDANEVKAFVVNYTIVRTTGYRTGSVTCAIDSGLSDLAYTDDYVDNFDVGVTLSVSQSSGTVRFQYTTTNTAFNGEITYSVTRLA